MNTIAQGDDVNGHHRKQLYSPACSSPPKKLQLVFLVLFNSAFFLPFCNSFQICAATTRAKNTPTLGFIRGLAYK